MPLFFLNLPSGSTLINNLSTQNKFTTSSPLNQFKDIFSYSYSSVMGLISLQKVQYIGLHVASAAR